MNEAQDSLLDRQLRHALGSPRKADFEGWRSHHTDAVAYLNPVVTEHYQRRRRMLTRLVSLAVAATIAVAVISWLLAPQQASFAQAVKAINMATTITLTTTGYTRFHSEDGKRTWLRADRTELAYRSPNLYRDTRYDKDGYVSSVEIVDIRNNKTLHLDMKSRKATWKIEPSNVYGPDGPFSGLASMLKNTPLEFVGQKELNGVKVNVFRYRRENKDIPDRMRTVDYWLDAKTKNLVRICDSFDPDAASDRNNPAEKKFSKGELMGSVRSDIVLDAELSPELFSLSPPEGFEIVVEPPRPAVTEEDLIEWLGATARFNDGTFFDTNQQSTAYRGLDLERLHEAERKDKADRTDVEQKVIDLLYKHMLNRNGNVMAAFAKEYAVGGWFRYLGKGVRLGSSDRIVLFYKLKSTGTYRAVYGDLTVKDVRPEDLPLPVEE